MDDNISVIEISELDQEAPVGGIFGNLYGGVPQLAIPLVGRIGVSAEI